MNFTMGISVAGVIVFVAAVGIVSPALDILQQPLASLIFLAYVVATSAFGLQNTTLIALRKTEYSLVQSILLGVRIPILFLLASSGMIGILLSFELSYLATYLVGRHVLKSYGIRFEPRISVAEIKRVAAVPDSIRGRVHLASIPMDDVDENAIVINALQRHATVAVQKSLVEGFGLTVTEAMWKSRPMIASRVGGIQDQIVDERDGLLVDDPYDLDALSRRCPVS